MLVLSRKKHESIEIAGGVTVSVVGIVGDRVKLGIAAPRDVRVLRSELQPRDDDGQPTCEAAAA